MTGTSAKPFRAKVIPTALAVRNDLNRMTAMILGWVLLAVGLIGFVWDPVLGIFEVDVVHNLVHLATGAFLLAGAYADHGARARTFNLTLGVVYLLVALAGFVAGGSIAAIMDINMADHWLHLALGVALLGVAFASRTDQPMMRSRATR